MNCPTCSTPLTASVREGISVDTCTSCGGTWLDDAELAAVVDARTQPRPAEEGVAVHKAHHAGLPAPGAERERTCPKCGSAMEKVNYDDWSGIIIDSCMDGVWLDGGEITRIEAWMEAPDEIVETMKEVADTYDSANAKLDAALTERAQHGWWHDLIHDVGSSRRT